MQTNSLPIGNVGTISVGLPFFTIGSGAPRALITAVQHGGELSPLWILKALVARQAELQATVTVIPVANPFGIIQGTRNEPIEGKDPNRQFPGKPNGDFSSRLAATIMSIARKQDFVIDLHTFSRQSPFLVGFASTAEGKMSPNVTKLINLLQPDIVWKVNEKKGEDQRFVGSFDGALAKENVPSVFIEMPNYQMIGQKLIDRIASGIINTCNRFLSTIQPNINLPILTAKYLFADTAGIFTPTVQLLQTVTANQTIGTVTDITNFSETNIQTLVGGVVMTIKGPDLIRTGSKIASIGIE